VNPFEFFFDCRKQVQVISVQIKWIGLVWHAVNAMFFEQICWTPTCVNRAIVDRNHQSFSCGALLQGKIIYSTKRSKFVAK
jgi:hypothetical protein